jgi:hypothetical protein
LEPTGSNQLTNSHFLKLIHHPSAELISAFSTRSHISNKYVSHIPQVTYDIRLVSASRRYQDMHPPTKSTSTQRGKFTRANLTNLQSLHDQGFRGAAIFIIVAAT